MAPATQLLRSAEALTTPGVQVIVFNANMRCLQCRDRVSKALSKMDNLLDYVVDVKQKEKIDPKLLPDLLDYVVDVKQKKVTVRGRVDLKKRMRRISLMANDKKRKAIEMERRRGKGYFTGLLQRWRWKVKSTDNLIQRASCFRCCVNS